MPRPDEGLIHAWIDGQLPADEAARVERLVATDAEWGTAAAEARGLVAASSRILSALDDIPRGVLPASNTVRRTRRVPWWSKAAAAVVVMVGASSLVLRRAPEPTPEPTVASGPQMPMPAAAQAVASKTPAAPPTLKVSPKTAGAGDRRDIATIATGAGSAKSEQAEASIVPRDTQSVINAAVQSAPAAQSRQVAGVMAGVTAARVAVERAAARMPAEPMADQPAKTFAAPPPAFGAAPAVAAPLNAIGACYEIRDSRTSAVTGIVMRGERQVGDTLFLAPVRQASPARGWVVTHDGVMRGVLTTEPDGRGMLLVTAERTRCAVP